MNPRLFAEHELRREIPLDDFWFASVPGRWEGRIPVPSCIETIPNLASYQGIAEYRCPVFASGNLLLTFHGVSFQADVSFDGKPLGSHYGAYGAFSFLIPNVSDGVKHEIRLTADNTFSERSALHVPQDYYSYLGITRPVTLYEVPDVYLEQVHFTPERVNGVWQARIDVVLANSAEAAKQVGLRVQVGEFLLDLGTQTANPGKTEISGILAAPDAHEYNPDDPYLYKMQAFLSENGVDTDDLIDRVGFREVKVEGDGIFMNGRRLKLHGFNRHEDYAEFGCAVPLQAMMRDIALFRDLGANCVRTCHYPNDQRFLDLCDEYGILIWEEGHSRGLSEEQMRNPNFMPQMSLTLSEMQSQHHNHPAIFVWALLNECATDTEYGRDCCAKLIQQIRDTDSSRPVTFACDKSGRDLCLGLVDIVSYNMYPLWYDKRTVAQYIADLETWINSAGGAGKPIIVSETGAGAIYGYRTETEDKWSEEYQVTALQEILENIFAEPSFTGVFLWQFADCRVHTSKFITRPKTINNKGVVDVYRRKKLAYKTVQALYTAQK